VHYFILPLRLYQQAILLQGQNKGRALREAGQRAIKTKTSIHFIVFSFIESIIYGKGEAIFPLAINYGHPLITYLQVKYSGKCFSSGGFF
jgi:hypothetical protein